MSSSKVYLDEKDKSVEGHIFIGKLTFDGKTIWERSCHDNTVALAEALREIDPRFHMAFTKKDKTVEGHTKYITVKAKGKVVLDKLNTHDNMHDLAVAVQAIVDVLGL
ncbi:hypothetical protein DFH27DRAFT_530557 [Peziza echinospora]|nr:hypothetical protein DFH27DRAFT_530557 [Peziza echinospora]